VSWQFFFLPPENLKSSPPTLTPTASWSAKQFCEVFNKNSAQCERENIEVRCVGDHSMLPESLRNVIATLEESTKHNTGLKLSIALSYSGRQDIVSACKRLMGQVQNGEISSSDMTEAAIDEELQTSWVGEARDPDLLIRTSGEQRISNFMLWQTAYSEFLFVDSLWPDFGETQLKDALIEYQKRNRRFGKHGN
jgi:ditrans,polycis-polyprenyl diphosphate synthase